jgi:hypothetical protein
MGILRGNNKPDFIKISKTEEIIGYGQMADVYRVEGPEK